ncbi:hypothetical protein P692DRAFT_20841697 [Suillus brevipes Sb2]|nr:hypothetical protein P692DRAFT_20841697 [Suillus brevipes Sb2]
MPKKSQALLDEAEESYLTAPTGCCTRLNMPLGGKPVLRRTDLNLPSSPLSLKNASVRQRT